MAQVDEIVIKYKEKKEYNMGFLKAEYGKPRKFEKELKVSLDEALEIRNALVELLGPGMGYTEERNW